MDSKFYVSLEAARLLKEKGYNEEVELFYNTLGELNNVSDMFCCEVADNTQMAKYDYLSAPSKDEAIDWLEINGIIIELSVTHDLCHWVFSIYMKGGEEILTNVDFDFESFPTRWEAKDAAIIKICELI